MPLQPPSLIEERGRCYQHGASHLALTAAERKDNIHNIKTNSMTGRVYMDGEDDARSAASYNDNRKGKRLLLSKIAREEPRDPIADRFGRQGMDSEEGERGGDGDGEGGAQ